jgi:predicted RNA binding protein YcfA (HicA-like mRNA interferase family)
MNARELLKIAKRRGCSEAAARGSHRKIVCEKCATVLAMHPGDIPSGTLRAIIKDLEPCLGKDWHKTR